MKNSFLQSAATHGLVIGVALIIQILADWALGYYGQNVAFSLLSYAILIGGLVWCGIDYRKKQTDGFLSYGKAYGYSVSVAACFTVVATIFSMVLMYVIDPGYMDVVNQFAEDALLESGLPQEQMDIALEFTAKFRHPVITLFSSFFVTLIISAIIALITSAIVKKNNPNPFAGINS